MCINVCVSENYVNIVECFALQQIAFGTDKRCQTHTYIQTIHFLLLGYVLLYHLDNPHKNKCLTSLIYRFYSHRIKDVVHSIFNTEFKACSIVTWIQ